MSVWGLKRAASQIDCVDDARSRRKIRPLAAGVAFVVIAKRVLEDV